MGLFRLAADKVAYIFGVRVTKRLRGKPYSVLEKLAHGHHVLRVYCKNLVGRMYEKFSTFLRVEVCVNRMKDLGLNKGLQNLDRLRQKLVAITIASPVSRRSPSTFTSTSRCFSGWVCRSPSARPK